MRMYLWPQVQRSFGLLWTKKSDIYCISISRKNYNPVSISLNCLIGQVQCVNILTCLRGFQVQIVNFLNFFHLFIPKRNRKKKTNKQTAKQTKKRNIEACLKSLEVMLEYWYMDCGIFLAQWVTLKRTDEREDLIYKKIITCRGDQPLFLQNAGNCGRQ